MKQLEGVDSVKTTAIAVSQVHVALTGDQDNSQHSYSPSSCLLLVQQTSTLAKGVLVSVTYRIIHKTESIEYEKYSCT